MSADPKKLPPRTHKPLKRSADEQADAGPSKKRKTAATGSAPKQKTTVTDKPTKRPIQSSTLKVTPPVAQRHRAASVEVVEDPADRCQSKSPRDPSRILELADGSDDEPENVSPATPDNDQDSLSDPEVPEKPAESAEAELSSYDKLHPLSVD